MHGRSTGRPWHAVSSGSQLFHLQPAPWRCLASSARPVSAPVEAARRAPGVQSAEKHATRGDHQPTRPTSGRRGRVPAEQTAGTTFLPSPPRHGRPGLPHLARASPPPQQAWAQAQEARRQPPRTPAADGTGPAISVTRDAPAPPGATRAARAPAPAVAATELGCAHFGSCSGCSLHSGLAAPPLYAEAQEFFRGLGLEELPAVMRAAHGWRCRAKLAVRGTAGRPLVGLFREGSHEVVDIVGAAAAAPAAAAASAGADAGRLRCVGVVRAGGVGDGRGGGGGASTSVLACGPEAAAARGVHEAGSSGGGAAQGLASGEDEKACRAHHPRINQATALIKELVTQLRIHPYNETPPATGRSTATAAGARPRQSTRAPRATSASAASTAANTAAGVGGSGAASAGCSGVSAAASAAPPTGSGLLRYLQLTAVPSRPGGRAEEDPRAGVQLVLVVNAPCPEPPAPPTAAAASAAATDDAGLDGLSADPRLRPLLALCRLLWRMAGPGGPLAPTSGDQAASLAPGLAGPPAGRRSPTESNTRGRTAAAAAAASASATPPPPPPLVHSIWLNFQPESSRNAILGSGWLHVAGPAAAWQEFGGVAACVGPGSFVQANYGAMQLVLREIAGMVPEGARVTELHAGIGVIGLSLAARRRLAALRLVEVNPAAAEPFRASLRGLRCRLREEELRQQQQVSEGGSGGCAALPGDASGSAALTALPAPMSEAETEAEAGPQAGKEQAEAKAQAETDVEYITAEAGSDPVRFLAGCDVLVVDPPRKGLERSLLDALTAPSLPLQLQRSAEALPARSSAADTASALAVSAVEEANGRPRDQRLPSRLVYLSCGFRALQSDLKVLLAGGWRLRSATAYLFFPGTNSLETLVLLTREDGGGEQRAGCAQVE